MGLDINIRILEKQKCDHCGQYNPGKVIEQLDISGRKFMDMVSDIGYADEQYCQYITLKPDQIKKVIAWIDKLDEYGNYRNIKKTLALSLIEQNFVEFEADW